MWRPVIKILTVFCLFFSALTGVAQNEAKKWYFGNQAGLDFMTAPPTILTNSQMSNLEGTASIANAAGNLLFYTNGLTVWNSSHVAMANGTGLLGNGSSSQSGVIVKQPGNNNIYYIFTQDAFAGSNGLRYSIVDMSLATGMGSVTVKNATLMPTNCEKITAVRHCNGIDVWVVTHDWNSSNFRSFLVTSSGISSTQVVTNIGTYMGNSTQNTLGCMKASPNGKKLGLAVWGLGTYEIYDFDNSTGVVSNSLNLGTGYTLAYGCEFSPDGTKFYACGYTNKTIHQWDICGTPTAVIASKTAIVTSTANLCSMQLATNGKIYVARFGQTFLGVIHNPNLSGAACSYTDLGQSIAPRISQYGLPNFITSTFKTPSPPFTYTINCQNVSFSAPSTPSMTTFGCASTGYSLNSMTWNFGDPASGALNTSTLTNPSHMYTSLGTFTPQLILNYSCGGGTDTVRLPVIINQACISVSSTSITCANLGSATVAATSGLGPYSYTWMPTAQTGSVATGLSPGSYTITVYDSGFNFTFTATTVFTSLVPLTGSLSNTSSLSCNGVNNGTASITNLSGGSGSQQYFWTNGSSTYTTPSVSGLSAGIWSLNVIDGLTGCTINEIFLITQPPALTLNVSSSSPTSCAGTSITYTSVASGGTGNYYYAMTNGSNANPVTISQNIPGTYIYTLNVTDDNSCTTSSTISSQFISNPMVAVNNVSICPLAFGTLQATGATTYTWNSSITGSNFSANPLTTTQYSVIGSALGCTSAATASLILKSAPVPTVSNNSPICNTQQAQFLASGGFYYLWSGPSGYSSTAQNTSINNATPNHSGIYNLTVTAANSCTAPASVSLTVFPSPTLTATGATVCTDQSLNLAANSLPGVTFAWSGPLGFSSTQGATVINNPPVNASGIYTVIATSAQGCTNIAVANVTVSALPVPSFSTNSPQCYGATLSLNSSATTGALAYNWAGPNGFNSVTQNTTISNVSINASGVYTLTVTKGPCVASLSKTVVINPLPVPTATSNGPVCENKSLVLDVIVTNGVFYTWNGPKAFSSPTQSNVIFPVTSANAGKYSVQVIDNNGCKGTSSIQVVVLPNPVLTVSSVTVCIYQPAIITASGAASYAWVGQNLGNTGNATATVSAANNTGTTVYTVTGTAENGCTTVATSSVTTRALPIPSLTISKSRVCLNNPVTLEGFGGINYEWFGPSGFKRSGKLITFNPPGLHYNGMYTLTISDIAGCKGSVGVPLEVIDLPVATLTGDKTEGCAPFCSEYSFAPLNPGTKHIISTWSFGNNVLNGKTFSSCFNLPGAYTVTGHFTDTLYGCQNSINFIINAWPVPIADFTYLPERPVELEGEVLFSNTDPGAEISFVQWYIRSSETGVPHFASTGLNTSYDFKNAGVYPVAMIVENKWGCQDTIVKVITVEPDFHIYVPNAFTPNEDRNNETFLPIGRGVKKYQLVIFDRWGIKIFETTDLENGWDGTYNGKSCPNDVYTWMIDATSNDGKSKHLKGHLTLMR
jgi:gliding motility-associated-like protein